jgi:hypothetical protein
LAFNQRFWGQKERFAEVLAYIRLPDGSFACRRELP